MGAVRAARPATRRCKRSLRRAATLASGGVVFYGTDQGGRLVGLDAKTGKRLWDTGRHAIHGPVLGAPSVADGVCYAGSWDGRLHAFRL
jgi:outer membrane protein assembly factor BamB